VSPAASLLAIARDAGFLVTTEDGRLFVEPVCDQTLPDDLRQSLKANKAPIIAYLEWVSAAAAPLIAAANRRLAASYPDGLELGAPWSRWDRLIQEAVEAGDENCLRALLAEYEEWGLGQFSIRAARSRSGNAR
jgi:hypothetical protein